MTLGSLLPFVTSRLFFLAAVLLILQTLIPRLPGLDAALDLYSTVFLPIEDGTVGVAVFAIIVGAALARRKKAGWVVAMVLLSLVLIGDLLSVVVLAPPLARGQGVFDDARGLVRSGINLVFLSVLWGCLVVGRRAFPARRPPGSTRRAVAVLAVGTVITVGVAMLLVTAFPNALDGPRGRFTWTARRIVLAFFGGDTGLITPPTVAPPGWINIVVGLLAGFTLLTALVALTRSQREAALVTAEDERVIRGLVAESPEDSLAYFATRRDKSVVYAPSRLAAVTYRVELGVCLASGDPIGPPNSWPGAIRAWLGLATTYGWTQAVIGASERGATAYARSGLRVLRLGDEAVLDPAGFRLEAPHLRGVRAAVGRLQRLGYTVRVRRHGAIPPAELTDLAAKVDQWRDTETERGFSMALGRLGDPADEACILVVARFPPGRTDQDGGGPVDPRGVAGILSFVPWGRDGLSLDVMRRHPGADNGVTELMVSAVIVAAPDLGVRRVSLNFAVFRSALEEGARLGAGPLLRLWRRLLLVASRWWQIESLFRANARYGPTWRPRFLCFAETRDIALVGAASGVAEGFLDLPAPLRLRGAQARARALEVPATAGGPAVGPPVGARPPRGPRVPEQYARRLAVRASLLERGVDPYPARYHPDTTAADLRLGHSARVAGRVLTIRDLGGVMFVVLGDATGTVQLLLTVAESGREWLDQIRREVHRGDHLGAAGTAVLSRSGELSLQVREWRLTAKALRPLPDRRRGLADPEVKVRQRYLEFAIDPDARAQLRRRSAVIQAVRAGLEARGFLEVETPILQTVHGGANARSFRTHSNAYDLPLYLRIAPELYLKRLMVGGLDRVFEIGRNFRNEGVDATHNPEFTMLEAYQSYADYTTMRGLAQELIRAAAEAAGRGSLICGSDPTGRGCEVNLAADWPTVTVHAAVSAAVGEQVTADTETDQLLRLARRASLAPDPDAGSGALILALYEHLVERTTVEPTFYSDFPAEVSPLARPSETDPRLAERWDLVAFGLEVGTAYSELIDPVEQRVRLTAQSLRAAGGDPEAMALDEDFLIALEYGMPPAGGLGLGMDRLVMMLTGRPIRETIAFPLVRPRPRH